ncbi:hypothetical protein [Wolbachia endosymbiont of Dirofilaria (Dirofilaria) immitis]|uniref:hypothetical protein n=1 Tax=Wolbachia endosymbiont of Dirofilaria (Dirofilaria) immitis TaxID=1812115 RepID=UPI00158EE27C|nr:hypothetical protein [Wolbachia endosymbiont of Dirofilaria (Dirofilaria) immitis]QKX02422.1 hypothetical protein GOY12_02540 [Wolbachia endosymbiont of Dirofilaria (Dirofilaria) immitis]
MTDKVQEDEFMKQYMDTCKEQIEKLAKDPELLNQTLKPFMQMSQQLMASSMLDKSIPDMVSNLSSMDITKVIAQIKEMIDYIKSNYKGIMKKDSSQIQELDESSKKLRGLVRKLIEKIENNKQ